MFIPNRDPLDERDENQPIGLTVTCAYKRSASRFSCGGADKFSVIGHSSRFMLCDSSGIFGLILAARHYDP